jgi:hypothetical protein
LLTWLLAIVCIIIVIAAWRIFLPLAIAAIVLFAALFIYLENHKQSTEKKRIATEQALADRIAKAKEKAPEAPREWQVRSEPDPASGKEIPRFARIQSDDGLCNLQVEERLNGARLAAIYCPTLKIWPWGDVEVKFDNRDKSDTMRIEKFSDGTDVYIRSHQYGSGGISNTTSSSNA